MGDEGPNADPSRYDTRRALLDAAGRCMARWGVTKTTVADLAAEAGCSRATVYRTFPGGKNEIMATYGVTELQMFFEEAVRRVDAQPTLEDALAVVITSAARGLASHDGFQYLLAHEPGLALPYLGFTNMDRLYGIAVDALAPALERFVPGHAAQVVEIAARITLSHIFQPSPGIDMRDDAEVRGLVRRHLLPISDAVSVVTAPTRSDPPAPIAVPA